MRIIAGRLGGRLLNPNMKNWPTRPTTDLAKEALFNVLENRLDFEKTHMLDLFGGTGNHSFEFISRGCDCVTYVDQNWNCVNFVKRQAELFECKSSITIIQSDVKKIILDKEHSYDYIFAGPPYSLVWLRSIPDMIFGNGLLNKRGLLVLEHNPSHDFSHHSHFDEKRKYGQTNFSFFAV